MKNMRGGGGQIGKWNKKKAQINMGKTKEISMQLTKRYQSRPE